MTANTEGAEGRSPLDIAIAKGRAAGKLALYFGAVARPGHDLRGPNGQTLWKQDGLELPWTNALMDGGLLKNGQRPDIYDGKVFWTCGGLTFWYAFYWWDRSCDRRRASNSGFYVRGFGWPETRAAFDYACATFPEIVSRQVVPLVLQEPRP